MILAACAVPKKVENVVDMVDEGVKEQGYETVFKSNGFEITDKVNSFPKFTYEQLVAGTNPDCVLELGKGTLVKDIGCDGETINYMEINGFPYIWPKGKDHELGLKLMLKFREDMKFDETLEEFKKRTSSSNLEEYL
ncbi:MAG: hypothetical protein ABIB71_09000 [Candidatus Woesearchaeota archaeon]